MNSKYSIQCATVESSDTDQPRLMAIIEWPRQDMTHGDEVLCWKFASTLDSLVRSIHHELSLQSQHWDVGQHRPQACS